MVIHGPVGFFPADDAVPAGRRPGFTRVGVETSVELAPPATFFARATAREFAMFFTTFSSNLAISNLRQVVVTRDDGLSNGPFNRQRYSNPAIDAR